jgi:hypothetical protein
MEARDSEHSEQLFFVNVRKSSKLPKLRSCVSANVYAVEVGISEELRNASCGFNSRHAHHSIF